MLWNAVGVNEPHLYNGIAEAGNTLFGASGALVAGLIENKKFQRYEMLILTLFTIFDGLLMVWGATTTSLWQCYWSYILFGGFYHFMITIARYEHFQIISIPSPSIDCHWFVFFKFCHCQKIEGRVFRIGLRNKYFIRSDASIIADIRCDYHTQIGHSFAVSSVWMLVPRFGCYLRNCFWN